MSDAGRALLGIGMAHGEGRAILAAEKAISSPLLETSMEGARSILLSITGGADLSLVEISEAAKVVGEAAHPDANIIFGANVDEELQDQIWVTVVATRFDGRPQTPRRAAEPTIRRTKDVPTGRGRGRERSGELGIDVPEFLPG
jgi:cell division protein FtsZ